MNKAYLQKAAGYCAYQERTQAQVRERLYEWGLRGQEVEEMIAWLISNNYLNEERFAKAFAGGKFRIKNWGRQKILFELKGLGLSDYCIRQAMAEIPDNDYKATLYKLVAKKIDEYQIENPYLKAQKIARQIIGKGFEPDMVWAAIKNFE
jgi:regulatory protein